MSAPEISRDMRRPWHEGEIAARSLAGQPAMAPVIRPFMTEQMRGFFPHLPLVFVAALDAAGHPAASLLRGAPGFVTAPDPLQVDIAAAFPSGDPLGANLWPGAPFGLIGVDFLARRRNRVNGRLLRAEPGELSLRVAEAFGNCPKYIAPRALFAPAGGGQGVWAPAGAGQAKALIARADTFFIATLGPDGVDVSHRGGRSGFVVQEPDGTLAIPDYRGNNYFNTFGNLLHDPAAALLFVDFTAGTALHLAGEARVDFSGEERLWRFTPKTARILQSDTPFGDPAQAPAPEAP